MKRSMAWKTWGDAFNSLVARGYDHGYAAWRADVWEARRYLTCPRCGGKGKIMKPNKAQPRKGKSHVADR